VINTTALLRFEDAYDVDDGLIVQVRRVSDKKRFALPLELEINNLSFYGVLRGSNV